MRKNKRTHKKKAAKQNLTAMQLFFSRTTKGELPTLSAASEGNLFNGYFFRNVSGNYFIVLLSSPGCLLRWKWRTANVGTVRGFFINVGEITSRWDSCCVFKTRMCKFFLCFLVWMCFVVVFCFLMAGFVVLCNLNNWSLHVEADVWPCGLFSFLKRHLQLFNLLLFDCIILV